MEEERGIVLNFSVKPHRESMSHFDMGVIFASARKQDWLVCIRIISLDEKEKQENHYQI